MAFDNNGQFQRIHNWTEDKQNKIPVTASRMDAEDNNFAAGLSKTLLRDGSVAMTGNLAIGNHKITGVSNGTANTDAVNKSQLDTKQDTITGAASTVVTSNLLANKLLVSNSSGKITASNKAVTDIPDNSNLVHKTGNETIAGTKIFTSSMITQNISPKGNITLGTSTNTLGMMVNFQDTTGKRIARIQPMAVTTTNNRVGMWVNNADNTVEKGIYVDSDGTTYAPTPTTSDNSTQIATTAFVKAQGYLTSHQSLSNYVTLNGNQTISGTKTFTANQIISGASRILQIKNTNVTRNTAPSANVNTIVVNGLDSAGKNLWGLYNTWTTGKANEIQLRAYKGSTTDNTCASIGVGYDTSGNPFTRAPTPATNDDSTKIATTAFVKAQGYITSYTDTKNTAGSTDTSSKIFLIGATSQAANPQTYSQDTVFVNTSGQLQTPTPDNDSNTTVAATTAFVKNVLKTSGAGLYTISKAANGYCKFNGGLIVQWMSSKNITGNNTVITLPTAFSNTNYSVVGTLNADSAAPLIINSKTTTTFVSYRYTGGSYTPLYIAIGY